MSVDITNGGGLAFTANTAAPLRYESHDVIGLDGVMRDVLLPMRDCFLTQQRRADTCRLVSRHWLELEGSCTIHVEAVGLPTLSRPLRITVFLEDDPWTDK